MDTVMSWFCENKINNIICNSMFDATHKQFMAAKHMCPNCFQLNNTWASVEQIRQYYSELSWEKYNLILPGDKKIEPQTQKARGLLELKKTKDGHRIQSFGLMLPDFVVINDIEQFKTFKVTEFIKYNQYRLFARPCPKTPRHGFLDSRPIKSISEAEQLFIEMKKVDPESELVIMQKIEASHNAVITNTTAAIGEGHDGATAGRNAITLPVHGQLRIYGDSVSITESAYLETVHSKGTNADWVVQLRNGPELPRTKDIIPNQVTVDEIIDINRIETQLGYSADDLLSWEKTCQEIQAEQINGKRKGLVIVHVGGCIGSHFSVHAVLNKIPFITSHMPAIGEILEPINSNPIDYRQVKKGIELGLSKEFTKTMLPLLIYHGSDSHSAAFKGMVYTSLYALHGYPVAGKEESKLIGLGIASLIRVSVCAALGEARHHKGVTALQGGIYRDKIYRKYFENVFDGIKKLKITEQVFLDGSWSDSYGGKNWASCTSATIKLVNKAIAFVRKPNDANFQKLMSQFNKLINEVHNGGKFLNKFVSNNAFDAAASDLALYVAVRADEIYEFVKLTNSLDETNNHSLSGMRQLRQMSKKDKATLQTILDAVDKYNNGHDSEHDEDCDCEDCS